MKKVAINGFGRIGRLVFRIMEEMDDLEVVAINDLTDAKQLSYLLKYDTAHRRYQKEVSFFDDCITVDGRRVNVYSEKDPSLLPWKELEIDLVFECTGLFASVEKASLHLVAGAKKVIISAPAKGNVKTIVYNVNHDTLTKEDKVISAASCTTNCLAPVLKVLEDTFGIKQGYMTTVHAYTNDQANLDVAHKKGIESRRGRASAANIVPTSTGAASAIGKVIPNLEGKLEGMAMRVPVITGSVVDLVLSLKKKVTVEEVNTVLKNHVNETLGYTTDPIVSSDVIGMREASLVDGQLTSISEGEEEQLVKVVSWYDNEMSYSYQMVRCAEYFVNL